MVTCQVTGCGHSIRHTPKLKSPFSSWMTFRACTCCATEIFPNGYNPPHGIKLIFKQSTKCKALLTQEIREADIRKRRKNQ